ncbi:unnamed protein product [Rotaria sordida]|uniref:Queuine tRNA-ribosyltransferase catalytic subunit 1 n=1 Tax=Rotaria sordida TaxID=392033 RepID=A0A814F5P6_9BILA|nr:unnamed protein product [Rotaria sordida]CAF0976223.1 unnamed protein product [Rotaria sordida]
MSSNALHFEVTHTCKTTKARVGRLKLGRNHTSRGPIETPVFMPVGTQGTLKGLTPEQLHQLNCRIILGNTYHLGHRPGPELLKELGGLHSFMHWDGGLLTDSGGFQMVSLVKLSEVTEEGVKFQSPHDQTEMLLTPEKSIQIQNIIGADIIMQLDDVVSSTITGPRVEEAMGRSLRWLDRCMSAHSRPDEQSLFPIIQGGLDQNLREQSVKEIVKRNCPGYAIGGLSGGEDKDQFWRMVTLSTDYLPNDKPRYLMGVGFAIDLVICSALGCDMFDCVFPTRTARFGCALVDNGQLNLNKQIYEKDHRLIDDKCICSVCQSGYTRSYLNTIVNKETTACHLLTIHNVAYQMRLMSRIRQAIIEERFPEFIKEFVSNYYQDKDIPQWITNSLKSVNIQL